VNQDTAAAVERRVEELLRRRSGSDRVVMACEMFDCARALVEASLRTAHPNLSAVELRLGFLHRLYGDELSAEQLARIARRLAG
jgi:hypothetical protein